MSLARYPLISPTCDACTSPYFIEMAIASNPLCFVRPSYYREIAFVCIASSLQAKKYLSAPGPSYLSPPYR